MQLPEEYHIHHIGLPFDFQMIGQMISYIKNIGLEDRFHLEGVIEPLPGAGVAPVHGGVAQIRHDRHVEIEADAQLHEQERDGHRLAARQEEEGQCQDQDVADQVEPEGLVRGVNNGWQNAMGEEHGEDVADRVDGRFGNWERLPLFDQAQHNHEGGAGD